MRICIVSQEFPPETAHGGIGTQAWNKAQGLTRLGHEVHVISCAGGGKKAGESGLLSETNGLLTVHRIDPPERGSPRDVPLYDQSVYALAYSWRVLQSLSHVAGQLRFDLVNFPEYAGEGLAFQLNRSRWNWVPVVVQLHGPLTLFAETVGWPQRDSRMYRTGVFMEGESIRMADALMASSANIADFSARFYGIDRDRIDVVHCGIDTEMFKPCEQKRRDIRAPTVLFVGNIARSKGVQTVFDATMRLRRKYPELRLRIVGRGDDLIDKMRKAAEAEGAASMLDYAGFVKNRAEMPRHYQDADVFASPATHEPGVANVYVEAMACGCPVVASDTGGASEAVDHGVTGFTVTPGDVDATAAAIDRLLADADLRVRLGDAGRRRVQGYFAMEHYVARVLEAYERARENASLTFHRLFGESEGRSA